MRHSGTPDVVHPPGWPPPRGYSHGRLAGPGGRLLAIGGQIGTPREGTVLPSDMPSQFAHCLDNLIAVVHAAGGVPTDIISMTVFVTDLAAYRAADQANGVAWRARFGKHYPAIALIGVSGLADPAALVEIQALAVVPA